MKRALIVIAASISVAFCLVASSFAQETEGLIPRLIKKMKGQEKAEKKSPAKDAPVKDAKKAQPIPAVPKAADKTAAPGRSPVKGAGQAAAPSGTAERTMVPAAEKMSKPELVKEIIETFDSDDEVLDYMPQIQREKQPDGKYIYRFKSDNKLVLLEDLDIGTLKNIMGMAHQTATRLNTDRITRQLETIRQTQRVITAPPPPPVQVRPPAPPAPPAVPPVQRTAPAQPPSQTNTPQPPPSPPPQTPRR